MYNKDTIYDKYKIPKNSFIVGHIGRFVEAKNHTTNANDKNLYRIARNSIELELLRSAYIQLIHQ